MSRYGETMLDGLSTVGVGQVACSSLGVGWLEVGYLHELVGLQAMYLSLFEFDVITWFYFLALATLLVVPFFTTVVTHYILG